MCKNVIARFLESSIAVIIPIVRLFELFWKSLFIVLRSGSTGPNSGPKLTLLLLQECSKHSGASLASRHLNAHIFQKNTRGRAHII
jgi:hypothetical protein